MRRNSCICSLEHYNAHSRALPSVKAKGKATAEAAGERSGAEEAIKAEGQKDPNTKKNALFFI